MFDVNLNITAGVDIDGTAQTLRFSVHGENAGWRLGDSGERISLSDAIAFAGADQRDRVLSVTRDHLSQMACELMPMTSDPEATSNPDNVAALIAFRRLRLELAAL